MWLAMPCPGFPTAQAQGKGQSLALQDAPSVSPAPNALQGGQRELLGSADRRWADLPPPLGTLPTSLLALQTCGDQGRDWRWTFHPSAALSVAVGAPGCCLGVGRMGTHHTTTRCMSALREGGQTLPGDASAVQLDEGCCVCVYPMHVLCRRMEKRLLAGCDRVWGL